MKCPDRLNTSLTNPNGLLCYRRKVGNPDWRCFMNTIGKIQDKGQVTIPTVVRRQAGLSKGDLVSFAFRRGKIVITPTLVIEGSRFSTADNEYTPAQRRVIDARLAKAEKGPHHGPFQTAAAAVAHMKAELKKRSAGKTLKRTR